MSKLDQLLEEYAEKHSLKDDFEGPEGDEIDCRFKDSCYALRSNMGTCPCELRE